MAFRWSSRSYVFSVVDWIIRVSYLRVGKRGIEFIKHKKLSKKTKQKIAKTVKEQWAKMDRKKKMERLKPWLRSGQEAAKKAVKKRWDKMTKEERLKCLDSWLKAGQKASKEKLAKMTEEEKRNYLKSFFEAGHKVIRNKFDKMTKEEKLEYVRPWVRAGLKAVQKQLNEMTKKEKLKRMLPAIKASQKTNPSSIEKMIWKVLDELNISYKIQVSFDNHKFVVDIYIPAQRLIIECNGDYWHNYKIFPEKEKRDKKLKEYANNNSYKLIELWESVIRKNPKSALLEGFETEGGTESCWSSLGAGGQQ